MEERSAHCDQVNTIVRSAIYQPSVVRVVVRVRVVVGVVVVAGITGKVVGTRQKNVGIQIS